MKAVTALVLCVAALGVTAFGAARSDHLLRRQTRLAGSVIANRLQFPWHTLLSYKDPTADENGDKSFICSGALISKSWVLSVATCEIGDTELADTTAVLGAMFREPQGDPHRQAIPVASRTRHPDWSVQSTANDIALYKLAQPVEITEYVNQVRLPAKRLVEATFVDQTLSVSGWGLRKQETTEDDDDEATQSPDEFYSSTLTFTDVEVVRNLKCRDAIGEPLVSRATGMCVSGISESGSMGACLGDAGDPAVFLETDDQFTLVGLVSMASAAPCDTGRPTALTRVTAFLDWIQQVAGVPVEE